MGNIGLYPGRRVWKSAWLVLLIASGQAAWAAHAVDKTVADLVAEADRIEIVRLEAASSRWSQRGNLIVTDLHFLRDRDLLGERAAGERFLLTQGGGTIGIEGHRVSGNPELQSGTRYLVFIDREQGELFSPFVAGEQGVYRLDADGMAHALSGLDSVHADELLDDVHALVVERAGAPARRYQPTRSGDTTYPAKAWVPQSIARPADPASAHAPLDEPAPAQPAGGIGGSTVAGESDRGVDVSPPWSVPRYHYGPTVSFPVVYDELPHEWTWSPHDQYQMSAWNDIVNGNLFLVSGTQLGTWSWGNNRFELVGWPSNQTMIDQFGQGWGANTLAVAWSRWTGNVINEVDIAFNPAFCWTLNAFDGADPGDSCWSFQQTMLHELGHGWGLDHPWETQDVWWDSVMNYSPKPYRQARLNTDDVNAVRARYGGPAMERTLISQWQTTDHAASMQPTYTPALPFPVALRHGQSLTLPGRIQIENMGTVNFANPAVDLYLSQNWNNWGGSYAFLRTASYTDTLEPFSSHSYSVSPTPIAATVPTGRYFFTLWLSNGQGSTPNRTSSSNPDVMVTVQNNPAMLAPTLAWQTAGTGRIGPLGEWDYILPAVAGRTYEFTTCPGHGGSADFDTRIDILGGAGNDDACGLQSRVEWTAPSSGNRTVRVRGFSINSQGVFVMAYRQVLSDNIFANGFQP